MTASGSRSRCASSFTSTATTQTYPLSLHDALPISKRRTRFSRLGGERSGGGCHMKASLKIAFFGSSLVSEESKDRKSTRLNSSHSQSSYAVFCLKKKKTRPHTHAPLALELGELAQR